VKYYKLNEDTFMDFIEGTSNSGSYNILPTASFDNEFNFECPYGLVFYKYYRYCVRMCFIS